MSNISVSFCTSFQPSIFTLNICAARKDAQQRASSPTSDDSVEGTVAYLSSDNEFNKTSSSKSVGSSADMSLSDFDSSDDEPLSKYKDPQHIEDPFGISPEEPDTTSMAPPPTKKCG